MIYIAVQLIQIFSAHGSSHGRAGIRGGTRGPRGPKKFFLHEAWHIRVYTMRKRHVRGKIYCSCCSSKSEDWAWKCAPTRENKRHQPTMSFGILQMMLPKKTCLAKSLNSAKVGKCILLRSESDVSLLFSSDKFSSPWIGVCLLRRLLSMKFQTFR